MERSERQKPEDGECRRKGSKNADPPERSGGFFVEVYSEYFWTFILKSGLIKIALAISKQM